jgi:transposase-like protein
MSMIGKVRRMHFRQGKSVREIARLTSLSRNTIRSWLREPEVKERSYRRPPVPTKLTPFVDSLVRALTTDAHRPRRDRRTTLALFQALQAEGYAGCYSRVTDFVRAWRVGDGQASGRSAFVPLAFEWGEAYQFDWSEEGVVVGGVFYRAQVAHLTLCASRAFWLVAYPGQGHEMLFDAHTRSFAALGGIARRGIYECKGLPLAHCGNLAASSVQHGDPAVLPGGESHDDCDRRNRLGQERLCCTRGRQEWRGRAKTPRGAAHQALGVGSGPASLLDRHGILFRRSSLGARV